MNNIELAIKFSNEKYCTKKDVIETMKTPLIDGIWNSVLEYRQNFNVTLSLKHINNSNYSVCLTPSMIQHISNIERKITRIMGDYTKMNGYQEQKMFKISSYVKILRSIANRYNLNLEDSVIENIVNGNTSTLSPELMILNRYLQCLLEIENNPYANCDSDCLAKFYSLLMGSTELTEFYRKKEVDNSFSRVVVGKLYLGVPSNTIDAHMNQLFDFINKSNVSMLVKAIATFYFIYYVKPFEVYSEEIAFLMLKKVFATNDVGGVSALINFEQLLNDEDILKNYIIESQKTLDLTYLIDYSIKKSENYLDEVIEGMINSQRNVIHNEIHQSEAENILNRAQFRPENSNLALENNQSISSTRSIDYATEIAISNLPTGLSEEEATRLENHLLELNPNLSRGQAYFYARHCTLGMNYTIAQYKKELGCAYETARSSMDNLVFLGYYRKENLKNKYIYTPVKKG